MAQSPATISTIASASVPSALSTAQVHAAMNGPGFLTQLVTCEVTTISWDGVDPPLQPPLYVSLAQHNGSDLQPTPVYFNVHDNATTQLWRVDIPAGRSLQVQVLDRTGRYVAGQPAQISAGANTACTNDLYELLDALPSSGTSLLPVIIALGVALGLSLIANLYCGVAALRRRKQAGRQRQRLVQDRIAAIWQKAEDDARYTQLDDSRTLSSITTSEAASAVSEKRKSRPTVTPIRTDVQQSPQRTTISNFVTSPASALLFSHSAFARGGSSLHSVDERSDVARTDAATVAGSESLFHRSSISSRDNASAQFFPLDQDPFQE